MKRDGAVNHMPRLSLRADAGIGAATISPNSRDVALAGRSGLYIVDLHDPFSLPRWLPLRCAWEVSSVQWCPHPDRPAWVVSSSNQKALVWNLALHSDRAVEHVLHGHRRAVTDINFSPHHPDQLATASIDTTLKLWDMRKPGGATMTFADFHAGAIQIRWNPNESNQLASAHDNRLVLWDKRKANLPLFNFEAHQGECNGVQFLANGKLLTCSTDRTIKVWDVSAGPDVPDPELTVEAEFPVWRALPTPFELGALVAPLRGSDNALSLINLARQTGTKQWSDLVVGSTMEHPQPVSTAMFLRTDMSTSHYDILSWSQDSHLRQWDGGLLTDLPHASSAAGCKDDEPPALKANPRTFNSSELDAKDAIETSQHLFELPILNRRTKDEAQTIAQLDWIAGVRLDHDRMQPVPVSSSARKQAGLAPGTTTVSAERLSQEIISVSSRFPKVAFGDINIGAGICDFSLYGPWGADNSVVRVLLNARVPPGYPYSPLQVAVLNDTDLKQGAAEEMTEFLQTATAELSRHNVPSLEFCIRYLVGDSVSVEDSLAAEAEPVSDLNAVTKEDERADAKSEDNDENYLDPMLLQIDDGAILDEDFDSSSNSLDSDSTATSERLSEVSEDRRPSHTATKHTKREDIIDSTPVPKNCGAVWSARGLLVCFFNHKPAGKDKGPLPLDKIFADDNRSEDSNAPFLSDSEDFELESSHPANNWSVTAAQLTANPTALYNASGTVSHADKPTTHGGLGSSTLGPSGSSNGRKRSRTATSKTSKGSHLRSPLLLPQNQAIVSTHSLHVKNMLHLWPCRPDVAAEYCVDISTPPLKAARHNAGVAAKYELWDEEYIWNILCAYINIEENESMDRNAALSSEATKFDWCGGSTGLRYYMPKIAADLEQQGKVQLLACMSIVLSSLRSRRMQLRRITALTQPQMKPMAIIDPHVEVLFQAQADGSVNMVSQVRADDASVYSKEMSPVEPVGSTAAVSEASWLESDLSGLSFANDGPQSMDTAVAGSRRYSTQLHPPNHSNHSHFSPTHLGSPNTSHSKLGEGPLISVEIDSHVFDLDSPPSSYIVRRKSYADQDFSRWLPRLIRYRKKYASLLRVWGLYIECAEISKLNPNDPLVQDKHNEINDSRHAIDSWVDIEASTNAACALCNSPVMRLFEYCDKCSHVLHSTCAQRWWELERECPSACGCICKRYVTT